MLDNFIYEDHRGRRFVGLENGVYLNYNDMRDYSWNYETINGRISRFYRPIKDRKLPLVVYCATEEAAIEVKNRLLDIAETDIEAKRPGKVYIGEYYTTGYITGSEKSNYLINKRLCCINLTLTSDDPAWYREQVYPFINDGNEQPGAGNGNDGNEQPGTGNGVDYPYAYPYDYALNLKGRNIVCDAAESGAFKLLIYGACENPVVLIGKNAYAINGMIAAGETLLIDSISKTITLTKANGQTENWFDNRGRDSYIFEPIPSGMNAVGWLGTFKFDLTVIEKRSEPRWT